MYRVGEAGAREKFLTQHTSSSASQCGVEETRLQARACCCSAVPCSLDASGFGPALLLSIPLQQEALLISNLLELLDQVVST